MKLFDDLQASVIPFKKKSGVGVSAVRNFAKKLLAQMHAGQEHYGQEIRQSGEQKAANRIDAELKKLGWTGAELSERPKEGAEKIRIARLVRQETTMTLGWIAQALHMGTKTHLSHLLYWHGKEKKKKRC